MNRILVLLAVGIVGCGEERRPDRHPASPPSSPVALRYAPPDSCVACHPREHDAWFRSQHDLAMQPAAPGGVLGDFRDVTFERNGVTSRFYRIGDQYWVDTDGADGAMTSFLVKYSFGVTPLQQYLVEGARGRLQALPLCWDVFGERWFHLYDEPIPHTDPLHWTGPQFTWNFMCADCHSTGLRKGYDAATDSYQTTFHDVDVSCQACHGPAARHAGWGRLPERERGDDNRLALHLRGNVAAQVAMCARCHSRRELIDEGPLVDGESFLDHCVPQLLRESIYHVDGQIDDEVYVYGSFAQSKMHARGVACTDCHDPHTARLRADGNALCVRCHQPNPPDPFVMPDPKEYDTEKHHFHTPGGPGSACVDCHMPLKTYMQVDPRRDHSFRIPRPDLTVRLGVPNACSSCHADQSPSWAATRVEEWFPESTRRGRHYGEVLALGRRRDAAAATELLNLIQDPTAPPIVRATALDALPSTFDLTAADEVPEQLLDPEPLVRHTAIDALARFLPSGLNETLDAAKSVALTPLLDDPVRAVRMQAARVLASLPVELRGGEAFERALVEYRAMIDLSADRPESSLNRAVLAENLGDLDEAERAYRRAIELDAHFFPARFNLAQLLSRTGRGDAAEAELRQILERDATSGDAQFSMGLFLAEHDRLPEAVQYLGEAARILGDQARVIYNYGLALQSLDRRGEAEAELLRAWSIDGEDPDITYAIAVLYVQDGRFGEALPYADRLMEITDSSPVATDLLERIERELKK